MKTLSCEDLGIDDGYVAKGETEEEVLDKMMEHIKMKHAEKLENTSEKEMKKTLIKEIKDEM